MIQKATLSVAAALLATAASAADLPSRKSPALAPAPAPAMFSWAGFYLGVNGGGAWNDRAGRSYCIDSNGLFMGPTCQVLPAGETGAPKAQGWFGGAQAGYNWQFGSIVAGLEGDLQAGAIRGSHNVNGPFGFAGQPGFALPAGSDYTTLGMDTFGTARLRLGYAVMDRTLAYLTGGLIAGSIKAASTFTAPNVAVNYLGSTSSTKLGWTVGGGIEQAFTPHITGKIEALYYDLGSVTAIGQPTVVGNGYQHNERFETHGVLVRVGLNYLFGGAPDAVVAKY